MQKRIEKLSEKLRKQHLQEEELREKCHDDPHLFRQGLNKMYGIEASFSRRSASVAEKPTTEINSHRFARKNSVQYLGSEQKSIHSENEGSDSQSEHR